MAKTKSISAVSAGQDTFQDIDGLLSGVAWDLSVITYSYPDSASDYGRHYGNNEPNSGFKPLNATQQAAVDYTIDQFDSVIALSFQRVEYGATNDKDAIIRYAE